MASDKPHLKSTLYSLGRRARAATARFGHLGRARACRDAELYARLGELNRQLVAVEAGRLALQGQLASSRGEQVRLQARERERSAESDRRTAALAAERDAAWQRVRELERSLGQAHSRRAEIQGQLEQLETRLEQDRAALQRQLDEAREALDRSRHEAHQLRSHGSRLLEAMQEAQRLADAGHTTGRELGQHLRHVSLQPALQAGPARRPDGGAGGSGAGAIFQDWAFTPRDFLLSRQLRLAAGVPLLLGALASAKVLWDGGQAPAPDEQPAPRAAAATPLAAVEHPAAEQARAELAALNVQPVAIEGGFDPQLRRQQQDLMALGFDLGHSRADGRMGARTRQALKEFEMLYLPAMGLQAFSGQAELASLVRAVAERARADAERLEIGSEVLAAIQLSHMRTGVSFAYLAELAAVESRFDPASRSAASTAAGLYQFTEDTWLQVLKAHGHKYGLEDALAQIGRLPDRSGGGSLAIADAERLKQVLDLRYDVRFSALMAGEFARDNERQLVAALGRDVGPTDLYFAHFLGAAEAIAFLSLLQVLPDEAADKLFPQAAAANAVIFHPPEGGPRTVAEVYALFDRKFNTGRYRAWDPALMLADMREQRALD